MKYVSKRRCDRLIKMVVNQCVIIKIKPRSLDHALLHTLCEWCKENIGERRLYHPIFEAQKGWIDYFDGKWAQTSIDDEYWFWFDRAEDKVLFNLTWRNNDD